ncbi:restriction endonuclease [Candidatus Dojkabacteria bacterium]|nr:restriction endonuclease [Candidatus Dojkabacteria bacterium]
MWVVRAGEGAHLFDVFKKKSLIAIGWSEIGDLSDIQGESVDTVNEEIKNIIKRKYPDFSTGKASISAGQVSRFRFVFQNGDFVLTYNPEKRIYLVGKIIGDYRWIPSKIDGYPHIRKVEWMKEISRDDLSTSTKNTLGAISTIFEIGQDAKDEIIALLEGKQPEASLDKEKSEEELKVIQEDVITRSNEFIKDKISKLDWQQMQELVGGILRAMGYKTLISPPGADRGKDIVASPDGLGLEEPRIFVEVKHRGGQMGRKEIVSFTGGLRKGSKALFVSTGGFSKDARYEAERSEIPLTLIDLDLLVRLIVEQYDNFDTKTRELVPLTKIYWPE